MKIDENSYSYPAPTQQLRWHPSVLCSADSTGRYGASSDSHQPKVGKPRHETIGNEVCKFGKVHGQEVLDGAARHSSMQPLGGKLQYSETVGLGNETEQRDEAFH